MYWLNSTSLKMTEVEHCIYGFEAQQQEIMLVLHRLLTEDLNLTAKIRYKIPFYFRKSWICYLNPQKNGSVELAFVRGNELSDAQGILDSKGRKQVCSIELFKRSEMPMKELTEIFQEAILLDDSIAYASKRKGTRF